jgi:hypothetical protein
LTDTLALSGTKVNFSGDPFDGQEDIGIQDQRARRGSASVVALAAELKRGILGTGY